MAADPAPSAEFFTAPAQPNQRRYEALRAYFVERVSVAEAGARAGYTRASMASLLREEGLVVTVRGRGSYVSPDM